MNTNPNTLSPSTQGKPSTLDKSLPTSHPGRVSCGNGHTTPSIVSAACKVIRGKLCALLMELLWSALMGNGQTVGGTAGRKFGFRHLKFSFILSLVGLFVFWHSVAKAQFSPIPLSGGALVKMTADYQRPCFSILARNSSFTNTANHSLETIQFSFHSLPTHLENIH